MPLPRGCGVWPGCEDVWMLVVDFFAGKPLPSPEVFYVWHWWCPTPTKQDSEGVKGFRFGCVEFLARGHLILADWNILTATNRIGFWIQFIGTPSNQGGHKHKHWTQTPDNHVKAKPQLEEEEKGSKTRKYSSFIWVQMRLNFWKNCNEPTDHAGSKLFWHCCPLRTCRGCSCSIYPALIQSYGTRFSDFIYYYISRLLIFCYIWYYVIIRLNYITIILHQVIEIILY